MGNTWSGPRAPTGAKALNLASLNFLPSWPLGVIVDWIGPPSTPQPPPVFMPPARTPDLRSLRRFLLLASWSVVDWCHLLLLSLACRAVPALPSLSLGLLGVVVFSGLMVSLPPRSDGLLGRRFCLDCRCHLAGIVVAVSAGIVVVATAGIVAATTAGIVVAATMGLPAPPGLPLIPLPGLSSPPLPGLRFSFRTSPLLLLEPEKGGLLRFGIVF
jgi:hypothetical protein